MNHICGSHYISIFGSAVLDPTRLPQLYGSIDWRWATEGNAKIAKASHIDSPAELFLIDVS